MKKLDISEELKLPLDAVTQTFAIMAKRGVGKTHTASVMAEEMLKQGQPVVIYDPTSAWWGLKSSADGKRPGFPVVIFGGEHADVPLEETAGEMIATVIVERRLSAILDCGLMRKGARIRFMTAFCETLYHKNREPIHFFIDEAQTVAPQNLKAMPEIARLVGALEDIILQGRRRGLGVTVISPRPAIVNTSIRSACEVLIAMQIVGPHDRKAIQEWIDVHGEDLSEAKEMMAGLSSLKRGEAWVWSPAWLELFVRTRFRKRETFDSSSTPEVGSHVVSPKKMARIDLAKLGAEIAATVERVKADDPKALRAELARLQRELTLAKQAAPKAAKTQKVEVPVLKEVDRKWLHHAFNEIRIRIAELHAANRDVVKAHSDAESDFKALENGMIRISENIERNTMKGETAIGASGRDAHTRPPTGVVLPPKPAAAKVEAGNGAGLPRPQQRILDALSSFEAIGVPRVRRVLAAFYSSASPRSSSYTNNLGKLRSLGLIAYPQSDTLELTSSGRDQAAPAQRLTTNEDLHKAWYTKLPRPQAQILRVLIEIYPADIDRENLAARAGASATSSAFTNNLGALRSLGAIDYPDRSRVRAEQILFPVVGATQ